MEKKLREAEQMNNQLVETILEKDPTKPAQPKPKILILGDSNIHKTKARLNRQKATWTVANNVFTTSQLNQALSRAELTEEVKKHDKIIVHLGTNDLRNGRPEAEAYQNLIQAATTIKMNTQAPVYLTEIPLLTLKTDLT